MADPGSRSDSGYRSFSYLMPGVDYKNYEVARETGRIEPYRIPLSKDEEQRVQRLYQECVVIALHDHMICLPADLTHFMEWSKQARAATAYQGLSASCIDAVFDNLLDGFAYVTSKSSWRFEDVVYDLGMRLSDIAHQDFIVRCEAVQDILRAHSEGRVAFIPSIECSTPIEKELDRIDVLYGLGIRMMGITYSESNMLGSGLKEKGDSGLTYFGQQAVERMDKLGIAIDIAHTGDRTSLDTIKASKRPVFISHAGARGVWNSKRMRPDEVIKACAERGGVIGIEAAPHTTVSRANPVMSIESVMDHFKYCVNLVGIEHVSFGLDTMYGDHVGLHKVLGGGLSMSQITYDLTTREKPPHVEYVRGMENPTEGYNNITRWLVKHGYSDDDIQKVIGGNVLRVLQQVWH